MKCTHVNIDGVHAIVCGSKRYKAQRCKCGKEATKLCDAVIEEVGNPAFGINYSKLRTCDEPLCDDCTTSPAKGKDYCKSHAEAMKVPTQETLGL